MKKVFHALIGLGSVIFFLGSLLFVFGQAICLALGQPELVVLIETSVDAVVFPAIALTGLLCYLYSVIYKKPKSKN